MPEPSPFLFALNLKIRTDRVGLWSFRAEQCRNCWKVQISLISAHFVMQNNHPECMVQQDYRILSSFSDRYRHKHESISSVFTFYLAQIGIGINMKV